MRVAELISGTSMDGIDVAVVDIGEGVHVVADGDGAVSAGGSERRFFPFRTRRHATRTIARSEFPVG